MPAIKSAVPMSLHLRFNLRSRSRLLPITHDQLITSCPINLSVGQSCIHFISPSLISNYPHQYPQSHNLGFHQCPLHDIKIKPNQLALYHLHITKLFYLLNQNTMFIIDNKTLTSNLCIVSITKNLSVHHSSYSLFQTITITLTQY